MFNDRNQLRQTFIDAYQKQLNKQTLNSLEQLIIKVINSHPEYHCHLQKPDISRQFSTDNNPFLHMALHISLEEQLQTNRPAGIGVVYQKLTHKIGDNHQAQHLMMNEMAEVLWEAQQNQQLPDDNVYLNRLYKLV